MPPLDLTCQTRQHDGSRGEIGAASKGGYLERLGRCVAMETMNSPEPVHGLSQRLLFRDRCSDQRNGGEPVDVDMHAVLEYRVNRPEVADVGQRVRSEQDEVREFAGLD